MTTAPDTFGMILVEIDDDDGNPHLYEINPHDAISGQRVMFQLLAAGLPGAVEAIEGLLGSVSSVDELLSGKVDGDLRLGPAADRLVAAVVAANPERMTRELLRNTLRDGKTLDDDTVFSAAYRRNYFELLRACYAVIEANRFLPLAAISSAVSKLAAESPSAGQEEKAG